MSRSEWASRPVSSPRGGVGFMSSLFLLLWAMTALQQANAAVIAVEHRILVLTQPSWSYIDAITTVMDGYGMPYDVVPFISQPDFNMTALLVKADGTGKYSGIVQYPSLDTAGLMTQQQVLDMQAYQARTRTRMVRFSIWPWSFAFMPVPVSDCTSAEQTASFTDAAPLGISGIKPTAKLNMEGLYRCPGLLPAAMDVCAMWANDFASTGIISPCNTTVVMTYDPKPELGPSYTEPTMAAAVINYADGREALVFTNGVAGWSTSSLVISHFVVSWITKGVIPGQRQVLLNTQVDDVFLGTELLNDAVPSYTANVSDYQAHADWQTQLNAGLPAGSNYKVDMVFNMNGLLQQAGSAQVLNVAEGACADTTQYLQLGCTCAAGTITQDTCDSPIEWCRNCTKDWRMPLGSGADAVPAKVDTKKWKKADLVSGSPVAAALADGSALQKAFFWTSHTFTHQNLNNATYHDCQQQWHLNQVMASLLGFDKSSGYSTMGVVTPQISGLSNGNCLKAMTELGYSAAVGDSTWPHLRNDAAPYHMLRTTFDSSNWSGFKIMARWATEVYYNAATRAGNTAEYNKMYAGIFNGGATWEDLVGREAERVVHSALLALRHDPAMFHQANLARLDGSKSLLMHWVEAVLGKLATYVNWPVRSFKMDDLLLQYMAREQRDAAGLVYTLQVDTDAGVLASVNITSTSGAAAAPITVGTHATLAGAQLVQGPAGGDAVSTKLVSLPGPGSTVSISVTGVAW